MTDCVSHYELGGEPISPEKLIEPVSNLYRACLGNPSCTVLATKQEGDGGHQSIIADFGDGTFDASNTFGICRNERLAISYRENEKFPWEVRALRKDFPLTGHQYHALENEPRPLCLYLASWESVQRSWTPQLFINRIFWWLRATAEGTIQTDDQAVEQLFFASPYTIVLPKGHFEGSSDQATMKLAFISIPNEDASSHTLVGRYVEGKDRQQSFCSSLSIVLDPVEYGPIEGFAHNLGLLQEILRSRNCDLIDRLKTAIGELVTEAGIVPSAKEIVLLILGIPRLLHGQPQGIEVQGFALECDICKLGQMLAVLYQDPVSKKYYKEQSLNGTSTQDAGEWKNVSIQPVNISSYPDEKTVRKYSGLESDEAGPKGVIAGVGALGGLIAQIWNRECWGDWHYVDADIIKPHNIVRHIATHQCVGHPKARVVSALLNDLHPSPVDAQGRAIVGTIESDDGKTQALVGSSSLIVDVTTTIHVPRIIAQNDSFPRTVSVFLSPSGVSAVMLMEDANRKIRCNSLEAQYYRAILDSEWGKHHLVGHLGKFSVGGGCREITLALSNEMLHIHAGNLARQLRKGVAQVNAKICVWVYQDETGSVQVHDVETFRSSTLQIGEWRIVLDEGLLNEARQLRAGVLPSETGGILLGIVDQKDQTITLVKACNAPESSAQKEESFTRAGYGSQFITECMQQTADIVTYVGEWHSHPEGFAPLPSSLDVKQHFFVHDSLSQEGQPALMMIVSADSIGFYVGGLGKIIKVSKL